MDKASVVLDEFLEPVRQSLSCDQARRLVNFQLQPNILEALDEFARKSDEGTLSDEERVEYEALVDAGDFIAILQATARDVLEEAEKQ